MSWVQRETVSPRLTRNGRAPRSTLPFQLLQLDPSTTYDQYSVASLRCVRSDTSELRVWLSSISGLRLCYDTMSNPFASPYFFRQPIRYLRWASHEKPAIFYSCCIAMVGPVSLVVAPPIRRYFGDGPREKIPMTYPSKCSVNPTIGNLRHDSLNKKCHTALIFLP